MPESMRYMQRPGTTAPQQPWMSLLNSSVIVEVGMYSGVAARAAEFRKHSESDTKCAALSWKCIPLAVESYGARGPEALKTSSYQSSHSWEYLYI